MMTKQDIHSVVGDEGAAPGRAIAPSSHSGRRTQPVILIHRSAPPPVASGDATELDEGVSSLGSVAVKLMARWTLPRMSLLPVPTGIEEESRDRRPNSQWEED